MFSHKRKSLRIFFTSVFFLMCAFVSAESSKDKSSSTEKSIIKIEHAQKTEYKKKEDSDEDMIILSGEVRVSVTKGSSTTVITATNINFNRATNILYAEGNITLEGTGTSAEGKEHITASTLVFNTLTLEGIFDNGRVIQAASDALSLPSGSTLIVSSEIFGRDSGGTVAFKNGNLTFCDDENPHWKIKASRIWLLPGGEFAFLNALLYVGRVPLLWLPAFYYPKDELIFNPAFGYRNREGYYINTTTYLYGRKPLNAKSNADIRTATTKSSTTSDDDNLNFISLMKTSKLKKQKLEGLILHNLNEDYTGDTTHYVKFMADYYANLGAMVGLDANIAPNSFLTSLKGNIELGFSNTIFKNTDNGAYVATNTNGERVSDSGNFMGLKTPFRYQANLDLTFAKPISIKVAFPIFSDPYFGYDFNTRAENMDWIDYAMNSTTSNNDDSDITTTTSFTWDITANHTFSLPEKITPYISTLSISNINSDIVFSSKANTKLNERSEYKNDKNWITYTPERYFFYPSQITPGNISAKIAGNIVKYPKTKKTSSISASPKLSPPDELLGEKELLKKKEDEEKKDKEDDKKDDEKEKEDEENPSEKEESKDEIFSKNALPSLTGVSPGIRTLSDITYSLDYSLTPTFTSQISYNSATIYTPEDFSWSDMQSTYYQTKAPVSLSSSLSIKGGFLSLTNSLDFTPVYQEHPYLKEALKNASGLKNDTSNGGYSESSIKSIRNADNNALKLDLLESNSLTIKPFYYNEYFSETAISWNTTAKLLETKYISTDPDEPEWEYLTMDLSDSERFTVNNLGVVLAAKKDNLSSKLSLSSTLPPQASRYSFVWSLSNSFLTLSAGTGVKQKSTTDDTWVKEDFSQSLSIKLFSSKLSLNQSFVYNLEDDYSDSLKFSLSGYGLQFAYTASYVSGYDFIPGSGWKAKSSTDKSFQPYSLSAAYTSSKKTFKYLNEKIQFAPSLSTSLVYDYLRPTGSYFTFIPAFTFKINKLLDITFSTESRNSSIFRYFCSKDDYAYYYQENGERNMFTDLFNSFRFDDESKRRESGFKLKTFKILMTHDLDDWDLNFEFSITPRYISATSSENKRGGKAYYDFEPYMKLSVSWRPLSSMKTQILDKYGEWKLNQD